MPTCDWLRFFGGKYKLKSGGDIYYCVDSSHEKNLSKMKCLHGETAAHSTTQNGSFWFCNQNPSCNFFCSEDEGYLFEKAIFAWRCTEQPHPRCDEHHKLAKMCVVKDLIKASYGRPFFVCSDKSKPCSFWVWRDERPLKKPTCCHGFWCGIRKVKKESVNKDRLFFCCPNNKETSCRFFEWVPEEQNHRSYRSVNFLKPSLRTHRQRRWRKVTWQRNLSAILLIVWTFKLYYKRYWTILLRTKKVKFVYINKGSFKIWINHLLKWYSSSNCASSHDSKSLTESVWGVSVAWIEYDVSVDVGTFVVGGGSVEVGTFVVVGASGRVDTFVVAVEAGT